MKKDLIKISDRINDNELDLALVELNEILKDDENCVACLKMRALIYQKQNQLSKAINDYRVILKFEPENKEIIGAKMLLENILSMSSLDVYECTNTHLDPWD